MKTNNKFKDTGGDISSGGKADRYWYMRGFKEHYKRMRRPQLSYNYTKGTSGVYKDCLEFGMGGIEFGNWVNGEGRYNFLVGCVVALTDMRTVTGFPKSKVGAGRLGIAFGARGGGKAMAHFEPGTWVINLTRHSRGHRFGQGGGLGAFAHEYGHFLDYWFGTHHQPSSPRRSLTLGRSTTTDTGAFPASTATMAGIANKIVQLAVWDGAVHSAYYKNMMKNTAGDYWFRHNEIFARCFEQFVHDELRKRDIINAYLTQSKYQSWAYPPPALAKKMAPHFRRLLRMMAKKV
jgi:hypothetical protein